MSILDIQPDTTAEEYEPADLDLEETAGIEKEVSSEFAWLDEEEYDPYDSYRDEDPYRINYDE